MSPTDDIPSERDLADLAALADGSLPAARRAEVEARVALSSRQQDALAEQRRAVEALRAAAEPAPPSLRARLEVERTRHGPAARRWRFGLAGAAAATAAVAALVIAVALPGGAGGPSAVEAAALTVEPNEEGPPRPVESEPALLEQEIDGLPFPNWGPIRWPASGVRSDELDGRDAVTVFYDSPKGTRVGYTILSGDAIDPPDDARRSVRGGVEYLVFQADGRKVLTWERDGHTCVLSGEDVDLDVLLALAAWRSDG